MKWEGKTVFGRKKERRRRKRKNDLNNNEKLKSSFLKINMIVWGDELEVGIYLITDLSLTFVAKEERK